MAVTNAASMSDAKTFGTMSAKPSAVTAVQVKIGLRTIRNGPVVTSRLRASGSTSGRHGNPEYDPQAGDEPRPPLRRAPLDAQSNGHVAGAAVAEVAADARDEQKPGDEDDERESGHRMRRLGLAGTQAEHAGPRGPLR